MEILTKLLEAEDKVLAKDYLGASKITGPLIEKYPLILNDTPGNNVWWSNYAIVNGRTPRPHLGEPGTYAHLRMLDDIIKVGISKPLPGNTALQMAIVMPVCSDIVPIKGPTLLNYRLNPDIKTNSYEAVRQSLRLFQSYILAISGGELRLELNFYEVNSCFQIKKATDYVGGNFSAPILQLPAGVADKSDMFWVIYPSDPSTGVDFGFSSGVSSFGPGKAVFICEDHWVMKKRSPDQGEGNRTDVERRMYLPEWIQHEFFHHLFSSWPELGLEKTPHEWFTKANWPADFTGNEEEDYYAEALNKRLYQATPSIAQKLKRAGK